MTRSPAGRTVVGRLALVLAVLALGAAAVETYARARHLDRLQARGIAVDGRRTAASDFRPSPVDWDVPYLPRMFSLDEEGMTTAWGACRFDHPGRTVLVLGDSTTRQASGGSGSDDRERLLDEAAHTWPGLVARELPDDVQVCVVAEDGYHPSDYVGLLEHLGPLLQPDLIVIMLCANDLVDIAQREAVAQEGWLVVYELPPTRPVYPPLWQPWLYDHSEAFRFLHYRLAVETGNRFDVPAGDVLRRHDDSLRRIGLTAAPLLLAYLPMLVDEHEHERIAAASLATLGLEVHRIQLSPPWEPLRRQQADPVHLSDQGQARVAEQLLPEIRRALGEAQ